MTKQVDPPVALVSLQLYSGVIVNIGCTPPHLLCMVTFMGFTKQIKRKQRRRPTDVAAGDVCESAPFLPLSMLVNGMIRWVWWRIISFCTDGSVTVVAGGCGRSSFVREISLFFCCHFMVAGRADGGSIWFGGTIFEQRCHDIGVDLLALFYVGLWLQW